MDKLPLSVSIISFNEEDNISRTLESIYDIASEIIIVDSHSDDNTVDIAKHYGAKVFVENWKGHIAQKNSALEKCTQDWILSLDCDEVVTDKLKQEIYNEVSSGVCKGYFLKRKTVYLGKLLNFAWQPDYKLRLVRKSSNPIWQGLDPHDELIIDGCTAKLEGELLHYSFKNMKNHLDVTIKYAQISAQSYHKNGRKFSYLKLIINPIIAFFKSYLINRAFKDGFRGLMAAMSNFIKTFLKYAFLKEIEIKNNEDEK